jgi:hypothetical protein
MIISYATNWSVIYDHKTFIVKATDHSLSKQKGDIKERILKIAQNKSSKRIRISEKILAHLPKVM